MRVIHLFYAGHSKACQRTLSLLEEVVEQEEDVMLVSHDVDTEAGEEQARQMEITTVPTTIVDGTRVIRGIPHSPEQVLGE